MSKKKNRNKEIQKERAKKMGKIYIENEENPFFNMNNRKITNIKQDKNKK